MNNFIEQLFFSNDEYYIVKTQDISNGIDTYPGDVYLVSFNLPRSMWGKKLGDITIKEYKALELMTVDANICLSTKEYTPFQQGRTIASIERAKPVRPSVVWSLIDTARASEVHREYYSWCDVVDTLEKDDDMKNNEKSTSSE